MVNKRLINTGVEAAPAAFDPLQNFETVTYTGNGGTQKITGYIRKGAAFASSGSYIVTGDGLYESARGTNGTSVSFWMRSTGNNYETPIYTRTASAAAGWHIRTSTGGNGINWAWQNSSGSVVFGSGEETVTLTDGWHHVVATWDGTTSTDGAKLYIDGSLFDSLTANATLASQTFTLEPTLGNDRQSGGRGIGTLDQIRFFNKALSSSEVTTLYGETYASSTVSTTDIFSDNSGVALYQLDGNANDTGGVSGKFGSAAIFNQSTSLIELPSNIDDPLRTAGAFAVSCWINPSSGNSFGEFIHLLNDIYILLAFKSDNKIEARVYNSTGTGSIITSSSTFSLNTWHHVVWTGNSTNGVTLYVNNSQQGNTTWNGTFEVYSNATYKHNLFGSNSLAGGSPYYGKLDDVRIYSDELTSTEVGYLYNNTTASIPTDNLTAYYKFDGDARDEQQLYDGTATDVTYAYNGTPTNINFLGMAFQPDLVWIKERGPVGYSSALYDSIRGATNRLVSNTTDANVPSSTGLTAFDSNGFTLGGSNTSSNASGSTYVAWTFKGGGTAVSNTDGTITSTVSANQDAGFSIVKHTAPSSEQNYTIGHGLSQKPDMVILKGLDSASAWFVWHKDLSVESYYLYLHLTSDESGLTQDTRIWGQQSFTDTVISTRSNYTTTLNQDYIAYCFHSVDGYQKIGSYTGNGGTNTITTGFQPRFLLIKASSHASSWYIIDNARTDDNFLSPNLASAEYTDANKINFTSTGFTLTNISYNNSGYTWIYLAIA